MTTITRLKDLKVSHGKRSIAFTDALSALDRPNPHSKASDEAVKRMIDAVSDYARAIGVDDRLDKLKAK